MKDEKELPAIVEPDLEDFVKALSEVRDFCWDEEGAFDCAHSIPAFHMLNMVEPVLNKMVADDHSDIWNDVVDELRWLAAYALGSSCIGADAQLVFRAILEVPEPRTIAFNTKMNIAKLPVIGMVN